MRHLRLLAPVLALLVLAGCTGPAPSAAPETFAVAKKLHDNGHPTCGFSNSWVTWVNLEQLSAWHNVPLASKANGLDGFDTVLELSLIHI